MVAGGRGDLKLLLLFFPSYRIIRVIVPHSGLFIVLKIRLDVYDGRYSVL